MKYFLMVALAMSVFACQQSSSSKSYNDKQTIKEVKKQIKTIIPCESISVNYMTVSTSMLVEKKVISYILKNPEIDFKNDSLTQAYSKQVEQIIRSKTDNLLDFNGFNIIFEKESEISPSFNKKETFTYIFNSNQS